MRARHVAASMAFVLGLVLGLGTLRGAYTPSTYRIQQGVSYAKRSSHGTLNTSATIDITGSDADWCSALTVKNDGPETIYVEEHAASVAAMTAASSPVYAGEEYVSPVACRRVTLHSPSGSTAYRLVAGY
jgi:hypothetical protein